MLVYLTDETNRIYMESQSLQAFLPQQGQGWGGGATIEMRKAVGRASRGGKTGVSFGRAGVRCLLGTARQLGGITEVRAEGIT